MADSAANEDGDDAVSNGGPGLHDRFISTLLDTVARERYPSNQLLDLLQSCMTGRDRERIADALLEKLAEQRYPSPGMLRRVAGLVN